MSTSIEWTDETLNPIRARNLETGKVGWHCTKPSAGCKHCYAEAMNLWRGTGLPFVPASREKIDIFLDLTVLNKPLHWKTPKKIFLCDMTDLFHEEVPHDCIESVFVMMLAAQRHTFQILTKRPARMLSFMRHDARWEQMGEQAARLYPDAMDNVIGKYREGLSIARHIWLGVSIEDQKTADERIPLLLQTPAAVRFVSAEPLLGQVDLSRYLRPMTWQEMIDHQNETGHKDCESVALNWVIPGLESGTKARSGNLQWVRDLVRQCNDAGTACFVKQIGQKPYDSRDRWITRGGSVVVPVDSEWRFRDPLNDRKGGDPMEWDADLRVREFPTVGTMTDATGG